MHKSGDTGTVLPYWNHNTAYYPAIRRAVSACGCRNVLDVGCGDGLLCRYLDDGSREITGIDPFPDGIRAAEAFSSPRLHFIIADFLSWETDDGFDAVIFSASLHHMEKETALRKAKELLVPGGLLYIVGLASPSSPADRIVEGLRVIPAAVSSRIHHIRTCEDARIPTSYAFPSMRDIRELQKDLLPGASLRYGLYYRYILQWRKP